MTTYCAHCASIVEVLWTTHDLVQPYPDAYVVEAQLGCGHHKTCCIKRRAA